MNTTDAAPGLDLEKLDSPFPWAEVKHVPGTSVVNASAMLLDPAGACIGLVVVLNTKDAGVLLDVERALGASSNPAKMRRLMQIARKEAEEYAAEFDNARIAGIREGADIALGMLRNGRSLPSEIEAEVQARLTAPVRGLPATVENRRET